jgi:hypothetical protein
MDKRPVWFVVNEVRGSRRLGRRQTMASLHTEWRMFPVVLGDNRDLVVIEEYAWVLNAEGYARKEWEHSRLVPAEMGLEEWEILKRAEANGSVGVATHYDSRTPAPVLPDGVYVYASWNAHYPIKPVTVEEVIEYAVA